MEDIKRIHSQKCPTSTCNTIQISMDGIQESKSSPVTTDVFSVTFTDCMKVYPIRFIRPKNKFRYDEQEQISDVIDDINANNCEIKEAILDNPKRAIFRCALSHSSTYACEYCEAAAVLIDSTASEQALIVKKYELKRKNIQANIEFLKNSPGSVKSKEKDEEKIETLKQNLIIMKIEEENELKIIQKKKQLAWPFSTMNGTLRTVDLIKYVVNRITNPNVTLDKHEKKGFKGKSKLLYQPRFHFINCIPCEYMHSGCLGVIKRLVECTFNVGENRSRLTKRKLSEVSVFNAAIKKIKMPRESSRRCRNLDIGVYKAQEYRNLSLFFFPLVLDCIPEKYEKEKMLWLYLTFALRACVIPNEEFDNIELNDIKNACKKFYSLFEKVYGPKNCTYSVHVIASHLLRIRGKNPLTATSAFVYESYYAELKNLFKPGTQNPLKQALENTLIKRRLEKHCCKKPIKYNCVNDKGLENNSMIYIYNDRNEHEIFNIIKVNDDNKSYLCTKQGRYPFNCPLTSEINWNTVGVYEMGPSSAMEVEILRKNICGKVIKVKNLLLTCPENVLREQ